MPKIKVLEEEVVFGRIRSLTDITSTTDALIIQKLKTRYRLVYDVYYPIFTYNRRYNYYKCQTILSFKKLDERTTQKLFNLLIDFFEERYDDYNLPIRLAKDVIEKIKQFVSSS